MSLGFSIFNISSACLSQAFVFAKLGLCIKDQWTLKHSDLHKSLSKDILQKFTDRFHHKLFNAAVITLLNFVATSALNVFSFGKDFGLVADLMLGFVATISAVAINALAVWFISREEMPEKPQTNQNDALYTPSIP